MTDRREREAIPAWPLGIRRTGATGLEPATSGVTGRRSNQLSYAPTVPDPAKGPERRRLWHGARDRLPRVRLDQLPVRAGRSRRGPSGGVVVDAGDALGDVGASSVRGLLEAGALAELAAAIRGAGGLPATDVALLPPVPDPEKIVCIGLNYREHAAEGRQEPPPVPTFFAKFRNSLAADGATVSLPAASHKVDYEAEVAFVVGRRREGVSEARGARPHRRLHAAQRPVGPRSPVPDAAVDTREGVRRRRPVRPGDRHRRRGRARRTGSASPSTSTANGCRRRPPPI